MVIDDKSASGENVAFRRIRVGPAEVAVPGDWRVTNDGGDGIVVLHLPLRDDENDLLQRPGFVQPNLVVRYTERSALDGGAAAVAADSFRGTRERFPGATLLDVTPFVTESGLPGRRQFVAGLEQRIGFEQFLWHVGVGDVVVEIVLTLPAGAPESFHVLGDHVASSVAARPEAQADVMDSVPTIPVEQQDTVFVTHPHAVPLPEQVSMLETAQWIRGEGTSVQLPGSVGTMGAEAWALLQETRQSGVVNRFAQMTHREAAAELAELGFLEENKHTAKAEALLSGLHRQPALELKGIVHGEAVSGRVWVDGPQASLVLGPTREDVFFGRADRCYVFRELVASVPVILAAWTGLQATWTAGVSFDVDEDLLDAVFGNAGSPAGLEGEPPLIRELLVGRWEHWVLQAQGSEQRLAWANTPQRGPILLERTDEGRKLAHMTSPAFIYQAVQGLLQGARPRT